MTELVATATASDQERLDQAEAVVRAFCGWHVAPSRTETLLLDGTGSVVLPLPSLHVTAIASVSEETADGVVVLEPSTVWQWSAAGYVLRHTGCWSHHPRSITVTFTHGFDPVPADLAAVVQSLATRATNNPRAVSREQIGPFSYTYSDTLTGGETAVLARYRLPSRP